MRGTAVTDTFTRTSASGWGSADTGQAWTLSGAGGTVNATDASTSGSTGLHSVPVANAYRVTYLAAFSQPYADIAITGSIAVVPTGATVELANLMTRATSLTTCYLFRVQLELSGAVTAVIFAPGGVVLASTTISGITYTAGLQLRVRAQSVGRIHQMKVWIAANPEPPTWALWCVDATYTGAGFVGVRSGVSSGNTNPKPVVFTYDNFNSVLLADPPTPPLPVRVLAAFGADLSAPSNGWSWTDITGDVLVDTVRITPGRRDDTSQTAPASCSFQLNNDAMAYSANNPMSPNYPNVRRNTPVWVIVDPATRYFGYADGWTPSWDTTGRHAVVSVSASGILRRLTQGRPPAESPLRRAIAARSEARAYWPMEDGAGATTAASGIPAGTPMLVGNVNFAADATEPGSLPLPTFTSTGSVWGWVTGPFNGHWQVDWYLKMADPTPTQTNILTVYTSAGGAPNINWDVFAGSAPGTLGVRANNAAGTIIVNQSGAFGSVFFNQWVHIRLMVNQVGGNIAWQLVLFPLVGVGAFTSNTVAGTVGGPTAIGISGPALSGMAIGHFAVHDAFDLAAADLAQSGFAGELATDRIARLCADAGVPVTITGTSDTRMGPQSIDTLVNCLRECETADGGMLFDGFGPGLGYITRSARYNQAPALTLDMANGQVAPPFSPVDDDQRSRNAYKVTRKGGSSVPYEDSTGPLGTDPLLGIGAYDSTATINVASDDLLPDVAAWLVHLGTTPGFRYPSLNLDLAKNPTLVDDWMGARLLSRIDVTNVEDIATGHAPGTVSLVTEGYTETLGPFSWRVAANCSLNDPWRVIQLAADTGDTGEFVGRLDTDGSALATAEASVAPGTVESWQAGTPSGPQWTAAADDLPFDLDCEGEQVRVGAVGNAVSDTFTRTVAGGWGTADSGQTYTTSPSANHSTSGTRGVQTLSSVNVLRDAGLGVSWPDIDITVGRSGVSAAPTGNNCEVHLVARFVDASNFVDVRLFRAPAGSVTIAVRERKAGVDTVTAFPTVSGVTASGAIAVRLQAIGSTVRARAWLSGGTEPGTWDVTLTTTLLSAGDIRLRSLLATGNTNGTLTVDWDDVTVSNPQTLTVTRGINGVQKAHPAGASISVWDPVVLAL